MGELLLIAPRCRQATAPRDDTAARGKGHPHAVRILARAWLYIIWHCWQDSDPYDPARHKALQRILVGDRPAAA